MVVEEAVAVAEEEEEGVTEAMGWALVAPLIMVVPWLVALEVRTMLEVGVDWKKRRRIFLNN